MITLYGIPNCDTMKKARAWLVDNAVDYAFHDYRKAGLEETRLRAWVDKLGWETLLNRRGMMWRKVPPEVKERIDEDTAIGLMLATPGMIRRPVLDTGQRLVVGFDAARYEEIFQR